MKNKKTTYILLALVALIWGLIFYRIFSGISNNDKSTNTRTLIVKTKNELVADSFTIYNNYGNPFGSYEKQNSNPVKNYETRINLSRKETQQPLPAPQQVINWPAIQYKGKIFNTKTGKSMILMNVDGFEQVTEPGKSINSITLVAVTGDSVLIKFSNRLRYIKRQK
jgi:hypothetical protein